MINKMKEKIERLKTMDDYVSSYTLLSYRILVCIITVKIATALAAFAIILLVLSVLTGEASKVPILCCGIIIAIGCTIAELRSTYSWYKTLTK